MKKVLFLAVAAVICFGAYYGLVMKKKSDGEVAFQAAQPELLLFQTKGVIRVYDNDMIVLVRPGKSSEYILDGPLTNELIEYKDREYEVIGKLAPINPIIVNSKPITAKIQVIAFGDKLMPQNNASAISEPLLEVFQQKIEKKMNLRGQIVKKFGRKDAFDIAKGRISREIRVVPGRGEVEHLILMTEDGDTFLLTGAALKALHNKFTEISSYSVVVLGSEILPKKDCMLNANEITFDAKEAYTDSLEPIK